MPGKSKSPKSQSSDDEPRDIAVDARELLSRVADEDGLTVDMLAVLNARTAPQSYDVPIDSDLAEELLKRCRATASASAGAELRESIPGFRPDDHQRVYAVLPTELQAVDNLAKAQTQVQLHTDTKLGKKNLLVIRVHTASGDHLARFYQGLGSEKDLQIERGRTLLWEGGQYTQLDERPLILDKTLRLAVVEDIAVMSSSAAYESLFGPMPNLKDQAKKTFAKTLGKLKIVGAADLEAACQTDINMMRKLASIERKLSRPGYSTALTQEKLVAFVRGRPSLGIELTGKGAKASLVFTKDPQHRWQLLKLLDDDNLHSALTGVDYEANSKSELG